MSGVLCFGEVLIDFLQVKSHNQAGLIINDYRQFPGGAPANAAVAFAKLGGDAKFLGQVGNDSFGDFLSNSLKQYGVDTKYLFQHPTAPTPLAFVHLDKHGERYFSFVRIDSADLLLCQTQIPNNCFKNNSLLHLCSNTLTTPHAAKTTEAVVTQAKSYGLNVCFDVNLRANLWPQQNIDIALVNKIVRQGEIIKFAREEFEFLADGKPEQYIQSCFEAGCKLLLITNGGEAIEFITKYHRQSLCPAVGEVLDTTAGGDAFIGAVLFILSNICPLHSLIMQPSLLCNTVFFASCAGSLAVSKQGAFPALPNLEQVIGVFQMQFGSQSSRIFLEHLQRELL